MAGTLITPARRITVAPAMLATYVVFTLSTIVFSNGIYISACLAAVGLIVALLWKDCQPAVLLFSMVMQWVQVVAFPLWMNSEDRDINWVSAHGGIATLVGCLGLVIMAATMKRGIKNIKLPSREEFERQAQLINERKLLVLYLFSTLFLGSIGLALQGNAGFDQILMTMANFKWVFFLVYGYVAWINKKNRTILALIVVFEFASGLYSYFSSFKEVIFFTILIALTFVRKVTFKQVFYGFLTGAALFFILLTWTAIKGDYRKFLNQGKKAQVVEVSRSDAFSKIGEKLGTLSWDDYQRVTGAFLYRAQYVFHLGKTMDRVPAIMPHEYGAVWWDNVSYVLMPRLFWPDKPIYQATIKAVKYTGINYAGYAQGASFSLGYFADSYIDFGYFGMYLPLILLALYAVFIYRKLFAFKKINLLFRFATVNTVLLNMDTFEADGLFVFGRLTLLFIVFWLLSKYGLGPIQKWLYKPDTYKKKWI